MFRILPDTFVKIPLIFFPSLLSSRACHCVQEFKSPGRIHDCPVSDIKCTPVGRGGGGDESRHLFSKGNLGVYAGEIGIKLGPVKLTAGFVTQREYPSLLPICDKDVLSKAAAAKLRLFARQHPHYSL